MAQDPTTIAFRFGYGLPLPEGAAHDAKAMLAALALPDAMAKRHPGMGIAAALPLLRQIEATRKAEKKDPAKKSDYRDAIKASDRAARAKPAFTFASTAPELPIWSRRARNTSICSVCRISFST